MTDGSADPDTVAGWWDRWPEANLSVSCGHGLAVLDIDGPKAAARLAELEREHGRLPATLTVHTGRPGGGEHRYFIAAPGTPTRDLASGEPFDLKLRGAGHYVVGEDSRHITGRYYTAVESEQVAQAPAWLLAGTNGRRAPSAPPRGAGEPILKGCRDSTLLSLAGSMRRVGMTATEIRAALVVVNRDRCQPPVNDAKVRELADRASGYSPGTPRIATPETAEAARELGDLLALLTVGLAVAGSRIVGRGREGIGTILLSNGDEIHFPKLAVAMSGTSLMEQVVSTVGAEPTLNNAQARRVVALMRRIGDDGRNGLAAPTGHRVGRTFLDAATVLDVEWSNPRQRWGIFEHLRTLDPKSAARAAATSVARQCVVARDTDGTLYVRSGWIADHVRAEDPTVPPASVPARMMDAGWRRPGNEGRIKASRPGFAGQDVQKFLVVPPGWLAPPGERVNGGERINARACARAAVLCTPVHLFTCPRPPSSRTGRRRERPRLRPHRRTRRRPGCRSGPGRGPGRRPRPAPARLCRRLARRSRGRHLPWPRLARRPGPCRPRRAALRSAARSRRPAPLPAGPARRLDEGRRMTSLSRAAMTPAIRDVEPKSWPSTLRVVCQPVDSGFGSGALPGRQEWGGTVAAARPVTHRRTDLP